MTPELQNKLKDFFENNVLAINAADSIRNGRQISIDVPDSDGNTVSFTFCKDSGKNLLKAEKASDPDVTFTIPVATVREIVETNFESVGQVGLRIFEKMLSHDPSLKVKAKLNVGILSLVTGGYLGVLTAGGSEVATFLASKGLSNIGKIKDVISRMKH